MIRILLVGLLLQFIFTNTGYSQQQISGWVKDSRTNEGIPFVTVYSDKNQFIGSTNEKGYYRLQIVDTTKKTIFSTLGYDPIEISYTDLKKNTIIYLDSQPVFLSEVVVVPGTLKTDTLGTKAIMDDAKIFQWGNIPRKAFALKYKIKHPSRIESIDVHLSGSSGKPYSLRCTLVESGWGRPKDVIINRDFVITGEKSGWVSFDFEEYNFWISEKRVYVIFEVLENYEQNEQYPAQSKSNPGFTYVSGGNTLIALAGEKWRRENNQIVSRMKISYFK